MYSQWPRANVHANRTKKRMIPRANAKKNLYFSWLWFSAAKPTGAHVPEATRASINHCTMLS